MASSFAPSRLLSCFALLMLCACGSLRSNTCGNEDGVCCAQDGCKAGLSCQENICRAQCDACPSERQLCSETGQLRTCVETNGCATWSTRACELGTRCEAGGCRDACPGSCVLGAARCTPEGLKVCARPASGACPSEEVRAPSSTPLCWPGACDGDFCWESPLPQGNSLRAISAESDPLLILDDTGNVLEVRDAQWTYSHRRVDARRLVSLSVCSQGRAVGVGNAGLVMKWTGTTWSAEPFGEAMDLSVVACDATYNAIAAGPGGRIYLRSPQGAWTRLSSPTIASLYGAAIHSASSNAWAVGEAGTIVRVTRTDDPALTTTSIEGAGLTPHRLLAATVSGTNEVFAVGAAGTVLRRFGLSWSSEVTPTMKDLTHVIATAEGSAYAVGSSGAFLAREGDGWALSHFTDLDLTGVWGRASEVHVVDGAGLWFNPRGGSDAPRTPPLWQRRAGAVPIFSDLRAIHGRRGSDIYAVGLAGTVLHRAGEVWLPEDSGAGSRRLNSVTVLPAGDVVVAGEGGWLALRDAHTATWRTVQQSGQEVLALWNSGTTVVAVGANGLWMERSHGEELTRVEQSLTQATLRTVFSGPRGELWAAGDGCSVLRKGPAGFRTESIPGCTSADTDFTAGWSDGSEILLGTSTGTLFRSVLGEWTSQRLAFPEPIHAIVSTRAGISALAAWGQLFQRTGSQWRSEARYLTQSALRGAYATPDGELFVAGDRGLIWRKR